MIGGMISGFGKEEDRLLRELLPLAVVGSYISLLTNGFNAHVLSRNTFVYI